MDRYLPHNKYTVCSVGWPFSKVSDVYKNLGNDFNYGTNNGFCITSFSYKDFQKLVSKIKETKS